MLHNTQILFSSPQPSYPASSLDILIAPADIGNEFLNDPLPGRDIAFTDMVQGLDRDMPAGFGDARLGEELVAILFPQMLGEMEGLSIERRSNSR